MFYIKGPYEHVLIVFDYENRHNEFLIRLVKDIDAQCEYQLACFRKEKTWSYIAC